MKWMRVDRSGTGGLLRFLFFRELANHVALTGFGAGLYTGAVTNGVASAARGICGSTAAESAYSENGGCQCQQH